MIIKNLGKSVTKVWEGLRPLTQKMLVGAMSVPIQSQKFSYDNHTDWELSRLLIALDERLKEPEIRKSTKKLGEINQLISTCIGVLQAQTESAEVFIQLAERALQDRDYVQIDTLADIMTERFSVGEMCEIVRQAENPAIRAIAMETIALMNVEEIIPSLEDPIYQDIARNGLTLKAMEYGSMEARQVLENFDFDEDEDFEGELEGD
jgi:hypothetical protein